MNQTPVMGCVMTTFQLPGTVEHREIGIPILPFATEPFIGEQQIAWTGLEGDWYWQLDNGDLPAGPQASEDEAAEAGLRSIAEYAERTGHCVRVIYKGEVVAEIGSKS